MKILHALLTILVCIAALNSCSNSLNDAGADTAPVFTETITDESSGTEYTFTSDYNQEEITTSVQKATDTSQFKYLDYLYLPENGESLNNEVVNGAIYEKYKNTIQASLNELLQFPMNIPQQRSVSASNWWLSLPGEVSTLMNTLDNKTVSAGLAKYIMTDQGQLSLSTTLDDAINLSSQLDENTRMAARSLTVSTLQSALSSFSTGDYITGAFTIIGGVFDSIFEDDTSEKLDAIQQQLQVLSLQLLQINQQLYTIEQKIDQLDYNIGLIELTLLKDQLITAHQNVINAQIKIEAVYSHLNSLVNKSDKNEYLRNLLIVQDEYDVAFTSAYYAALNTQAILASLGDDGVENYKKVNGELTASGVSLTRKVVNPDACWAACLSFVPYIGWTNATIWYNQCLVAPPDASYFKYTTTLTYKTKKPAYFLNISIQDLALLKRLSINRLDLLGKIYKGTELLQYRASFAAEDIKKLQSIKQNLNSVGDRINTYAETMTIDLNPGETITWETKVWESALIDENLAISVNSPANTNLVDSIKNYLLTSPEYNDYFTAVAIMLAEWEIILKAHIAAAQ